MAAFKTRSQVFLPTSLQVGNNGTKVTKLIEGLVTACVPAMAAHGLGTGSAYIAGVANGDAIIMQLASQGASGIGIQSASIVAANTASLTFCAWGGATTASAMTFNYLVVK